MLNEAKTSRPRPRPRPKIIMKKYQIINNIHDFRLLPEKLTKFPNFTRKIPDYIIRQRDRGQAEAKCLRPRPKLRGRGRSRCQSFEAETEAEAKMRPKGTLASRT